MTTVFSKRRLELLKNISFFSCLKDADLGQVADKCIERQFARNAIILSKDDEGDTLHIVESGRVKAVLTAQSGREIVLAYFGPGEFFGEMSFLDNKARSADVVAVDDTRVLTLSMEEFWSLAQRNMGMFQSLINELCARLRQADEVIMNLALMDVYGRVANYLIGMIKKAGKIGVEWCEIENPPTQLEIANTLGSSRETVSRIFAEYRKRGILKKQGRKLFLKRSAIQNIVGNYD